MGDRRTAGGSRLLDPVWHRMQTALDMIYREIELDATVGAMNAVVINADGTVVVYSIDAAHPRTVHRHLVADPDKLLDAFDTGMIDATPEDRADGVGQ